MNMNVFATQLIQNGQNPLGGNNLFGLQGIGEGIDFWSIILGNFEEFGGKITNNESQDQTLTGNDNLKTENADLALLQLALLGQDSEKTLEEKLSDLKIERLALNQENRVEQLTKLINHLTSGLPQQAVEGGTIENLIQRLEKRLEKLESGLEALRNGDFESDEAPFKALIATGLNPLQLTNITDRINEVEQKLGRELTVEDLIVGVGNIIPVPGTEEDGEEFSATDALALFINQNSRSNEEAKEKQNEEKQNGTIEGDAIADTPVAVADPAFGAQTNNRAKIDQRVENFNAVIDRVRANQSVSASSQAPIEETAQPTVQKTPYIEEINQPLSNAEYKSLFGAVKKLIPTLAKMNMAQMAATAPTPATGQTTGQIFSSFEAFFPIDGFIFDGFDIQTGMPLNSSMQAAAMVTSSTQAGQTHPATQLVAAQISKAAKSGDTKQITLQLDPPDLGRVEIRLEFGEERTVKAHLVVEKPETYLMLQRDANALEKALANAGLDTNSDSLNFEMASDEYAFNSGSGNGNDANGTSGDNAEDGAEFIETEMTWDVDPETGHVHYSILA